MQEGGYKKHIKKKRKKEISEWEKIMSGIQERLKKMVKRGKEILKKQKEIEVTIC